MESIKIIQIILFFIPIIFSAAASFILYETWYFLPPTHERIVKALNTLAIISIVIYAIYSIVFAWSADCLCIICLLIAICRGINLWGIQPLIVCILIWLVSCLAISPINCIIYEYFPAIETTTMKCSIFPISYIISNYYQFN